MAVALGIERKMEMESDTHRTYTKSAKVILSPMNDILSNSFLLCTCTRRPKGFKFRGMWTRTTPHSPPTDHPVQEGLLFPGFFRRG